MMVLVNNDSIAADFAHRYRECGRDDVWLISGFVHEGSDGDKYTSVINVESAHSAINKALAGDWSGCGDWSITLINI